MRKVNQGKALRHIESPMLYACFCENGMINNAINVLLHDEQKKKYTQKNVTNAVRARLCGILQSKCPVFKQVSKLFQKNYFDKVKQGKGLQIF